MALNASVNVMQSYGPVNPALSVAPIHFPEVRTTDGLGIEEGTTNLILNPRAVGLSNWGFGGATAVVDAFGIVTITSTVNGNVGVLINTVTGTSGAIYSLSIYADTPRQINPDFGDVAAVSPAGARRTGTVTTTAAGTRLGVSIVGMTVGEKARLWLPQVEQKPYVTSVAVGDMGAGYAWNGSPNASTSTRAPARVQHALSNVLRNLFTLCCWVKVGNTPPAGLSYPVTLTVASRAPSFVFSNGTSVQFSSLTDAVSSVNLTYAPGDMLFLAGTLDASGTVYTMTATKNGGALISGASSTSAGAYGGATSVDIGSLGGGSQVNSGIEQVLLFNRVLPLTAVDGTTSITSLATGGPVDYPDDLGIVYATGTALTRGTTTALTAAGTGLYRRERVLPANIDLTRDLDPSVYSYGSATVRVSVPPGSGVGAGQVLEFGTNRVRVLSVYAPGGQYDELYAVGA